MTKTLLPLGLAVLAFAQPQTLFAQVQGEWLPTGAMQSPRFYDQLLSLPSGNLIAMGGYDNSGNYLASAELFNPKTHVWALTGSMANARESFGAAVLSNGKVLVAGGAGTGNTVLDSAELYDPASGTWSSAGTLATPRYGPTATLLKSGKVLFAGGCSAIGCTTYAATSELYDPATNSWSATGSLINARAYHSAVRLQNGDVLAAAGFPETSATELYTSRTGQWTATGSTASIHYQGSLTNLPDGKVLIAGGVVTNYPLSTAELYDPSTGTWTTTASMGHGRYAHTAALLPDGTVVVAGGIGQSISCGRDCTGYIPFALSEIFSEAAGTFTATTSLDRALAYHATTLLKSGQALTAGGEGLTDTCCIVVPDAETYTPLTLSFSVYALNFGLLQIGLTSPAQSVTVTNVSAHQSSFTSIQATGDYAETNDCPATLAAGQNCTISVTFTPTKSGLRKGSVTLRDNDPGSPMQTIALTATGETLSLGFTPASLSFGSVAVGSSVTQSATLTNDSAATVSISGIAVSPANHTFTQVNTCPATLAVQQSCTVTVTFTPPDTINYAATVGVAGAGPSATMPVKGNGIDGGG